MAGTRGQTVASVAALAALGGIAVALAWKQADYDPAEYAVPTAAPAAREGGERQRRGPGSGPDGICDPRGMEPAGAVETFGPETLSDRVNGKADLYLAAGFRSLSCARFRIPADPARLVERCEYEMGTPRAATQVFLAQKRDGGLPFPAGGYGYAADGGAFLVAGSRYVEMVASDTSEDLAKAMAAVAGCLAAADGGDE
jgi:hypothetical protein